MDDFYRPTTTFAEGLPQGLFSEIYQSIPIPVILAALLLGPLLIFLTAQLLLIGAPIKHEEEKGVATWMVPFQPVPWRILESFFGIPQRSREKYIKASADLQACNRFTLNEPHLSTTLDTITQNLQTTIPQMISFINTTIDLQPWELHANAQLISSSLTELDFHSLLLDITGHAVVSAIFGQAFLEKCPDVAHDVFALYEKRWYLLNGLPAWTPWPGVMQTHIRRRKVWLAVDAFQKAVDGTVEGMGAGAEWGYLEDVSELVMKRNKVYREHGLELKERADITILHSLLITLSLHTTWLIHHILNIPTLLACLRSELTPHIKITKPFSIGSISEAPKLELDHEGIAKKCPLLRSSYLETLRLVDKSSGTGDARTGLKGEIAFPETFDPERFLNAAETGSNSSTQQTQEQESLHRSRQFTERVTLAIVAAILVFWDFEPAQKGSAWRLPAKKWNSDGGIAVPDGEVSVRVKRRKFEWED